MSAGTQVLKSVSNHQADMREVKFPSLTGVTAGTYNLTVVVASNGDVSFRLTEPLADATLSTISTLTIKDGIIVGKA